MIITPKIQIACFAIYTAICFAAGWWVSDLKSDAAKLITSEATSAESKRMTEKAISDARLIASLNDQLATRQVEVVEKIRVVERKIPTEVLKHVPNNPDCAYSAGAVRLLNEAISTYQPEPGRDPKKPVSSSKTPAANRVRDPSAARSLPVHP